VFKSLRALLLIVTSNSIQRLLNDLICEDPTQVGDAHTKQLNNFATVSKPSLVITTDDSDACIDATPEQLNQTDSNMTYEDSSRSVTAAIPEKDYFVFNAILQEAQLEQAARHVDDMQLKIAQLYQDAHLNDSQLDLVLKFLKVNSDFK